jgi:hypothetical protein
MNASGFHRFLPIVVATLLIPACQTSTGPDRDPSPFTSSGTGSIAGKVVTGGGSPATDVRVSVGARSTWVNADGEFFLGDVPAGDRVLVNFSSVSTTATQKVTTVRSGRTSWVEAATLPFGAKQTIDAAAGGTVNFSSGASVVFPADAFVDASGQAYSGPALVTATWFNPASPQFYGSFPGEFRGLRSDGSETGIESFGFVRVDITGGGAALQLGAGKEATMLIPIPAALQSRAPATIPLWCYDEANGRWVEEGSAARSGNDYVGTVHHFSAWNWDNPVLTSFLEGRVVNEGGMPLPHAVVHTVGVDYIGVSNTFTNDSGYFTIGVNVSSTVAIWANYYAVFSTPRNEATLAVGQVRNIGVIVMPVESQLCVITGRLVDNGGLPLSTIDVHQIDAGRERIDHQYPSRDGRFTFYGRTGRSYTVEFSWYADSVKQSATIPIVCSSPGTMDLGNIAVDIGGVTVTGRVVNASGNPIEGIWVFPAEGSENGSYNSRETLTDAAGAFSLWVRPNRTFTIRFTDQQQRIKIVATASGALGSTTGLGDIVFP